jgi:hypothetical protein
MTGSATPLSVPPERDTGFPIQVDVQYDAERVAEISMPEQCLDRIEQCCFEAVLSQEALYTYAHGYIIVQHKGGLVFRQDRHAVWLSKYVVSRFISRQARIYCLLRWSVNKLSYCPFGQGAPDLNGRM